MQVTESIRRRFWKYTDISAGCWIWRGARSSYGYGMLNITLAPHTYQRVYAHRISYEMHHAIIPGDMQVMHSCDNPPCVNPEHLSVGSRLDNMNDSAVKDRVAGRKLTADNVIDIRSRYSSGTVKRIRMAEEYGVHVGTISRAIKGRTWRHVS